MSQEDTEAADADNVEFIASKMLTFSDVVSDPRYIVIGMVQFIKLWFAFRLIIRCDSICIFLILSYADTFVSQIVDNFLS